MTDLDVAAADLSRARSAFEMRPHDERGYVRLLECESRFLRLQLGHVRTERDRLLRQMIEIRRGRGRRQ